MKKILVTGGCGYIGCHTIVDLIENNYYPVCLDNNVRSTTQLLDKVKDITNFEIKNNKIDLLDVNSLETFFMKFGPFEGVIHFAAYKDVNESVERPLMYFENNLFSLINLIKVAEKYDVKNFIFSSSCSIYGNIKDLPVTEESNLAPSESPYGLTKRIGEEIIEFTSLKSRMNFVSLRYFNPAGAHPSGLIGEAPGPSPTNLVPAITYFASGKLPSLNVFGGDYDTRDGSCIRDFVHVCDISHAHTLALNFLNGNPDISKSEVFNLGCGDGYTILETISAFEEVSNISLDYKIIERREGDVIEIYSDSTKANQKLKWFPKFSLKDIMRTAWEWECRVSRNRKL